MIDKGRLDKGAVNLSQPPAYGDAGSKGSILAVAASSYGARPTRTDQTHPTGFDPTVAALFEAVVESAFLVANADGVFDETEKRVFQHVVLGACHGAVESPQIEALLADLAELLEEDGMDERAKMVARTITRLDHAEEVIRVATLIAYASEGVSAQEHGVLEKLTAGFGLEPASLEKALTDVESALS